MERNNRNGNFRIPTPTLNNLERSDATRVSPIVPVQVSRALTETKANRPSLAERRKRVEEERRKAELAEAARKAEQAKQKAEQDRLANIALREQRKREEQQRQYERDKEDSKRLQKEQRKERDEDFDKWKGGLGEYSLADKDFFKSASKLASSGGISGLIGMAGLGVSSAWFTLKDMLGSGAISSIDMNGQSILGKIDRNNTALYAAQAHDLMLDYQESIDNLKRERDEFAKQNNFNPEKAALNPQDKQMQEFAAKYNDYNTSIRSVEQQMKDPELQQLDNLYKQLYSIRHAGVSDIAKLAYHAAVDQYTYDQYKGYVANKRRQEEVAKYNQKLKTAKIGQTLALRASMAQDLRAQVLLESLKQAIDQFGITSQEERDANDKKELLTFDREELQREIKRIDYENEQYQKQYLENRQHAAESKDYWKVRDSFRKGEQAYQTSALWSPYYWVYEMPNMMGSSMSSPSLAMGMAILGASVIGAGLAAATGAGALSPLILNAGQVASTPYDIQGGLDENYGEMAMKRTENILSLLKDPAIGGKTGYSDVMNDLRAQSYAFWKSQGWTDKQIQDYLSGEEGDKNVINDLIAGFTHNNDGRLLSALIKSTAGLEAQFEANNIRTMSEMIVQKAMMWMPTGKLKQAASLKLDQEASRIIGKEFVNKVETDAAGRATARTATAAAESSTAGAAKATATKYANGFRRTERTLSESIAKGASQGAEFGEAIGLGYFGSIAGGAIGGTARGVAHMAKEMLSPELKGAYYAMEDAVTRKYQLIYDKLMPTKEWAKLAIRYGLKTAKSTLVSSMSEAAEEAVQYMNEKDNFAAKYGWGSMSIGDLIINDISKGGEVFKSYLSLVGLADSPFKDDAEYWANVKGGFALGGAHTGVMTLAGNTNEAIREYRVNDAIIRSATMNRELDKIDRAANAEFARQAMANKEGEVLLVLEKMLTEDSRRQTPNYSQEDYDEKIKAAKSVMALTKSKDIQETLKKSGIVYGTEQYAHAIADIYNMHQRAATIKSERDRGVGDIASLYNNESYIKEVNDAADMMVALDPKLRNASTEEKDAAKLQYINHVKAVDSATTTLRALVGLRAQYNTVSDFYNMMSDKFGLVAVRPDAKTIKSSIDKQIDDAIAVLQQIDPEFKPKTDKDILDYLGETQNTENVNQEEIELQTQQNAMLNAATEVNNSYLDQVGKPEYIKRVNAIIDANERNKKLDWMVQDIYNGDGVNKLMETLAQEATKEEKSVAKEVTKEQQQEEPFGSAVVTQSPTLLSNLAENKAKYQERKAAAKRRYENRKNRYKRFKKGNLHSGIPFLDVFVTIGNELIRSAEIGTYKFALFVSDIKDIASDVDINSELPTIKLFYIKARARYIMRDPAALQNMSSVDEVNSYVEQKEPTPPSAQPEPDGRPLYETILSRINEDASKIVESVSSHYITIVDDGSAVAIYRNKQAIQDGGGNVQPIIDEFVAANTSDEEFRKVLQKYASRAPGFPVEDYVKYRNVEGIEEAVAFNYKNWVPGLFVRNGIKVQLAVTTVLLGGRLDPTQYPSNLGMFIQDITEVGNKLRELGLTILNTDKYIYGTNSAGENISVHADIIAADGERRIYIIDVRSGYRTIRGRYTETGAIRSIEQLTKDLLQQAEQIIENKFRKPVTGMYMLPVIYNEYSETGIQVEKEDNKALIPIKVTQNPQYSSSLEELKKSAQKMVDDINNLVEEYNSYIEEANKYTNTYSTKTLITFAEYTTAAEYSNYMDNLRVMYDNINSELSVIIQDIQDHIDREGAVWGENMPQQTNDIPAELSACISALENACNNLDVAVQQVPKVKITTQNERAAVRNMYIALFEAQKALDNLLQMQDANTVDVRNEEELIASVMEMLAEYPENFGAAAVFQRRWWANNFVIGPSTNTQNQVTSVSQQFAGFINTINSWVDTLHNHVVGDLDNYRQLLIWYSSLLNNYFSVLLDNASKFSEESKISGVLDGSSIAGLNTVIAKGRRLIQQFNDTWGAPTDEQFDGPPTDEVERINRMPVKWKDLYGYSMMHSPAVDAMEANDLFYEMSTQPDFEETAKINFYVRTRPLKYTGRYGKTYEMNVGDVVVYIEGHDRNGKKIGIDLPFFANIDNYPNATVELAQRIAQLNRGNIRFVEKVRAMLEYIKSHPEYKIYTDISTNKGSIKYDGVGVTHSVSDFLFANDANKHDLFDISVSAKDDVGMTVVIENRTDGTKFYDIRSGNNLKQHIGNYNDVYLKGDMAVNSGMLIYFYKTSNGNKIGVPMPTTTIGNDDATRLVYLMQKYLSGQRYEDGFDIMLLLKQRLYIRDPKVYHSQYNIESNMVTITNTGITIGGKEYNISTQKQELISRIAQMSNSTNVEVLNSKFAFTNDGVLNVAYNKIVGGANDVTLPNGLTVTREDFEHNTSWLGYMMRNGLIATRAIGVGYTLINFGNPVLTLKTNDVQTIKKSTGTDKPASSNSLSSNDPFDFNSILLMTVDESKMVNRTGEQVEDFLRNVRDYFNKVLGENAGEVRFVESDKKYLTRVAASQVSVGVTTDSIIELSNYAPDAVAPHEAFHKIMELLIPDDERESFYKMYREHTRNGRRLDDRSVAEGLCDLWVDYTNNIIDTKNAPWYKKFFKWCKSFTYLVGLVWRLGPKNSRKMFTLWHNIEAGEYAKSEYKVTQERRDRFNKLFPNGLYYTVKNNTNGHTAELEHIADSGLLSHMIKSLAYYIMEQKKISNINPDFTNFKIDDTTPNLLLAVDENGKSIMDNLCGTGLPEAQITAKHLAFREIFESREQEVKNNKGNKVGTTKTYPKFDAISQKVAEYISTICGEYTGKLEENDEDEVIDFGEVGDVQNMNIDKYDKAAYEINKLEGTTKRVKLFFATIPYTTRDNSGNVILDTSRSIFDTPTYMPINEVYNTLVNDLHDVKSIKEMGKKLNKLAKVSTMHYMVASKFFDLVKDIYKRDENGNIIVDYDKEQLAIQIVGTVSSQKMDFIIANSKTLPNGRGKLIETSQSFLGRDLIALPKLWTKFLLSGQVSVLARTRDSEGNFRFNEDKKYPNGTDIFSTTAKFIEDVRGALSTSGVSVVDGVEYNFDSLEDIAKIKKELVRRLHNIGIMITEPSIDYMLLNNKELGENPEDRDLGRNGLLSWLTLGGKTSVNAFLSSLRGFVNSNGAINQRAIKDGYTNIGFIKDLAKWQAAYNKSSVDNRTLALNGKELHSISQNDSVNRRIDALNTQDLNNEVVRTLLKFGFNVIPGIRPEGSIILRGILLHDPNQQLVSHTYIGFKTDNKGDGGSEYTEEATVDDYMAKFTMLQEGKMLFPTLADKGTWKVITGINIPGMRFSRIKETDALGNETGRETTIILNAPTVRFFNGLAYIMPPMDQINQMIEYAKTERLAIQRCMADLGCKDIPGYETEDRTPIPEEAKVVNYHTTNKAKVEPNGTRFLGLTLIVVKEGNELVTYNLNDPNKSSVELLKLANDKFFSKSPEQQADIMALTLHKQNNVEVLTAIDLGIVEREDVKGEWTDASGIKHSNEFKASIGTYYTLNSKFLNQDQIEALTAEFMRTLPHKEFGTWGNIPNNFTGDNAQYSNRAKDLIAEKQFRYRTARGLAIAAMLNDATIRHIISAEEALRCFIGHPAFFKVTYDKSGGKIKDSAFDIQKRIGGLISTGEDNVKGLPGIPETYTVAECKDYEVASTSNVASNLEQMFVDNNVREMYGIKTGKWSEAYSVENIDDLPADGAVKLALEHARQKGKEFANAFTGGINVADGAAYITDTMCENLLRMRGAYNNEVKEAFEILRSDANWTKKRDAYKKIYNAVNIVPFKYTAYGFRDHVLGDEEVSDIAIPYYDKYALFPLFNGVATGNLASIYLKMLDEKVDAMLMNSAVKVGSQGAVSYDGESIKPKFNKYTQYYADVRRQLNTDPESGDKIAAGTQMIKIALQNLRPARTNYVHSRTGEQVSGRDLLTSMMQSINQLAINGALELKGEFCYEGTNAVDPEKLSRYLNEQLGTRNATKAITEIIQTRVNPETGIKELVAPLSATPDASWIESIVISTVNKKVIDITTPGGSFTQRSVFAMEGKPGEGGIQSDANMSNTINNGEKLQMLNGDGSMDSVITMDYFDEIIFKGKLSNMSFEEKKLWLIDHNVIGKNAKANTIGYRIPTQAQSSIHALRFVDIIPAGKATIILPEEFTKITGSDFDIDHLYLASYNYQIVDDMGEQVASTSFHPNTEEGKFNSKYHQNNILDVLLTLLKDSKNSINSLYKSIDNDTKLITDIADLVPESGSTKELPYNFGTLHEQVIRKNDYITGKTGIGPFALNVTNQILTQLFDVHFKDSRFNRETGIEFFNHLIDVDDNYISSWLSAFINAHVDIVKDPYISKLNVNPFTYNMINLLIRSGYGDVALWFCAQPIIRDMANASSRAKSQYTRDQEKAKSAFAAEEYAIKDAVLNYLTESEISEDVINRYTKSKDKRDIQVRINTVNWVRENPDVLAEIVKNPEAKTVTVNGKQYYVKNIQKLMFYAWKTLEPKARALGNMVQHTKIDTRKHGKDLISINRYKDAYEKLFYPIEPDTSQWDIESLRRLEEGSWIGVKTDLAIQMPSMILGGQTFNANPEFLKAVFGFGNMLSTTGGVLNNDALKLISRSLQTAVKSQYFVKYVEDNLCKEGQTASEYIRSLVLGSNSMANRLTRLKNQIETNPKYARLANNHLINQIYSEIEEAPAYAFGRSVDKPAFVTVLNNVDNSRVNSELLMDGWEDLLRDEDYFVRRFANDLIIYSFFTSGEFKGWNKMFKYVPPAWILGQYNPGQQNYAEYIKETLQLNARYYSQFFEDVIANNAFDSKLVRKVPIKNSDDTLNFIGDSNTIIKLGKLLNEDQRADMYVLIREGSGYNTSDYNLYKFIDYIPYDGDKLIRPIYARVKKKGYTTKGYNVYEYGYSLGYGENENDALTKFDVNDAIQKALMFLDNNVEEVYRLSEDEHLARAMADVYLGKVEPVVQKQEYAKPEDSEMTENERKEAELAKNDCMNGG